MSHLLDELLAQAANGSPATVALSAESAAVLLFAGEFLGRRANWLDRGVDPLDEVTDADWDEIEKLVGNLYEALMNPLIGLVFPIVTALPSNMLPCDGSTHLRADYPALYLALDAAFIVDADHFITPDLRGRVIVASGNGPGLSPYAVGATGGEEKHALSQIEGPSHSHELTDPGHSHTPAAGTTVFVGRTAGGTTDWVRATAGATFRQDFATAAAATGITIGDNGSNVPHNNIQPYLSLNYGVVAY